jgi:hypothetical protein
MATMTATRIDRLWPVYLILPENLTTPPLLDSIIVATYSQAQLHRAVSFDHLFQTVFV